MARPYRHWSKEKVVAVIRELNARGVPLNVGYVARHYPALAHAARKHWGAWLLAVEAAGFNYDQFRRKESWSRDRVLARINELRMRNAALNAGAVERGSARLFAAACAHFGSWGKAIEAAGLDYSSIRRQRRWTKALVIEEIRRMGRAGLKMGTTAAVRREFRALHAAAVRLFGSWAGAVRAAGTTVGREH